MPKDYLSPRPVNGLLFSHSRALAAGGWSKVLGKIYPNPSPSFIFTQNSFEKSGGGSKIIFSTKGASEIQARTVAFIFSLVCLDIKTPKVTHGAAY